MRTTRADVDPCRSASCCFRLIAHGRVAPFSLLYAENGQSSIVRVGDAVRLTRSCKFTCVVTRRVRGHGVGLAVVNDLVASHDSEPILTRPHRARCKGRSHPAGSLKNLAFIQVAFTVGRAR